MLTLLRPARSCFRLPLPEADSFPEDVRELRARAAALPDELMVVLVGDMITEEALPTYMGMINGLDGVRDDSGTDAHPWAQWTRSWTAEEKRHGESLGRYLWLTGRVSGKAIDGTVQRLIASGMNPGTENNPYLGFIYTSFQERATKVCHGNTARMAKQHGDDVLAKLTGLIAADEGRHEVAYQRIVAELGDRDPHGVVLALADMMRKTIQMPAHNMDDGEHLDRTGRSLFTDYAAVAEKLGVYSAYDYADILEYLLQRWNIGSLRVGEAGSAADAQAWLMAQPQRVRRLAEIAERRRKNARAGQAVTEAAQFSWIFNREVALH
jgi:acyl-[acyl-carrier-protein] desaturase